MLSSINPLGERARNSRWAITAPAYVLGHLIGGLGLGTLAWILGAPIRAAIRAIWQNLAVGGPSAVAGGHMLIATGIVALGALIAALLDATRNVPSFRRQVNEDWLIRYRGWVYGLGFGVQLGFGVVTTVTTSSVYLLIGICMISPGLALGLLLGAVFGLTRALPLFAVVNAETPAALARVHRSLAAWERSSLRLTVVLMSVICMFSLAPIWTAVLT